MKTTITGRHLAVTSVLRAFALEKVARFQHYFENIQRAEVIFSPEKAGQFSAEVILHAPRGSVLVVHAQDRTATAAFDTAMEKMERQLARLKDKLRKAAKGARGDKKLKAGARETADAAEGFGDLWW